MAEDKKNDCKNPELRDALGAADALRGFMEPTAGVLGGVEVGNQLQTQQGFKLPVLGLPAETETVDLTDQLPSLEQDLDPMVSVVIPGPCGRGCCKDQRVNMRLSEAKAKGLR